MGYVYRVLCQAKRDGWSIVVHRRVNVRAMSASDAVDGSSTGTFQCGDLLRLSRFGRANTWHKAEMRTVLSDICFRG